LSHVHSNVETGSARSLKPPPPPRLQLSHVHSNVETLIVRCFIFTARGASIEPRSFKRGNHLSLESVEALGAVLQLSHVHSNVETGISGTGDA